MEPENETENVISKGIDEGKQTETWNLEREHRRKRRDHQKGKTEKGYDKRALGVRKEQKVSLKLQDTVVV